MLDPDLEKINDSFRALRDHFEDKGKVFIVCYYLLDEEVSQCNYNFVSTSANREDYADALLCWAGEADRLGGPESKEDE